MRVNAADWSALSDLYVLRLLERGGPLSGSEVANRLRPLAGFSGAPRPVFPTLHRLTEQGLLSADPTARPPLYAVTPAGVRAAAALESATWPRVAGKVQGLLSAWQTAFRELAAG